MARVLYVDDEQAIRRALRSWLTKRGHTVFTAGTISEARAVLESEMIDGAFIDVWLGHESGFDLFEWIDLNQPAVAEHVVFVSGDVVPEPEVARVIAALERPVLAKPFDLGELERIIQSWPRN